ncbi:uncharacterized protein EI97DRAFT_430595 [Westerdykella ornata]|uniref:Helix-turn-helix domain-containing protein n=1 Tax=Westerdykella ornata TaxID=318751 RepID=A0A6A6JTW4_WESOR|nr:uncharacterized protein EI97DRAFT_430595 [Westerdykella ornata]KAF2279543.1 hypothetical protein EI97DRAFT_430595 [Westerdykella ornata]
MGSSASKGARAAGSAARKYPTRVPSSTTRAPPPAPAPPNTTPSQASQAAPAQSAPQTNPQKNNPIDLEGPDPGLAARLQSIGAVQPNPHYSPSSMSSLDPRRGSTSADIPFDMAEAPPHHSFPNPRDNPALRVLEARQRIQDQVDQEQENSNRKGFQGRSHIDAGTIQLALMRQKRGEPDSRIEAAFGLKKGRLAVLKRGVVETVQDE